VVRAPEVAGLDTASLNQKPLCVKSLFRFSSGRRSAGQVRCRRVLRSHAAVTFSQVRRRASRPVGRVLCARSRGPAAIHLGLPLPAASCGLPASIGRAALNRSRRPRGRNRDALLDLAPGGVCQAARVTPGAGGLLHHRFTLTPGQAGGGLFSVALSRGSPRVGVTDHPALRSPDLPPRAMEAMTRRGRPAGSPAAAPRIVRYPPGCRRCPVSFSDRSSAGPSANQSISVSDATSR
jgi:hypothetical protein